MTDLTKDLTKVLKFSQNTLTALIEYKYKSTRAVDFFVLIETGKDKPFIVDWFIEAEEPTNLEEFYADNITEDFVDHYLSEENRRLRDIKLTEVDVIVSNPLRFSELSEEQRLEAATYRKLLLDVPQQKGFPTTYEMPKTPEWLN